ncbi:MAG: KEOPS complex subunit Pcc1 [Haloarculaceae archaeon]
MTDRPPRRATIRTRHERPGLVAAALRPDNTDEMATRVERADGPGTPGTVVTRIERDDTAGLRTTADDYVSNLRVAQRVLTDSDTRDRRDTDDTHDSETQP